jgi:uncharacterized membrane protein YhaH (DUF805 family)
MLFSANGRIRRRDFWLWSIAVVVLGIPLEILAHIFLSGHSLSQLMSDVGRPHGLDYTPFDIAVSAIMVVLQWPFICLTAKRWHDRNRPGYIAVVIGLMALASSLVKEYFQPTWMLWSSWIFWQFVECGCLDGTKGPNKYGPSPKQIQAPADVF